MNRFLARLPDRQSIIGVYATAVFLVYGWTMFASFWQVPSWLFYLKISEILSIYAYSFVINFGESVTLIFLALFVGIILPGRWWNAQFKSKGALWIFVLMGSIMVRLYTNRAPDDWEIFFFGQQTWWAYTLLLGLALDFAFSHIVWLRKSLDFLADQMVVFLYIYLPLTIVSLVVVVVRNLF
jgi:hypothetical protein